VADGLTLVNAGSWRNPALRWDSQQRIPSVLRNVTIKNCGDTATAIIADKSFSASHVHVSRCESGITVDDLFSSNNAGSSISDSSFEYISEKAVTAPGVLVVNDTSFENVNIGVEGRFRDTIVHRCSFGDGNKGVSARLDQLTVVDSTFRNMNQSVEARYFSPRERLDRAVILNNTFVGCNFGVMQDARTLPGFSATLQNNRFVDMAQAVVALRVSQSIVFSNNEVRNCTSSGSIVSLTNWQGTTHVANNTFDGCRVSREVGRRLASCLLPHHDGFCV
jgi:hypothetical protein